MKTGRIGYDVAVIFCRDVPAPHLQYQATIRALRPPSELDLITDRANALQFLKKFGLFFQRVAHRRDT